MSTLLYAVRPNVVAARARSKRYLRRALLQRKPPTLADRVASAFASAGVLEYYERGLNPVMATVLGMVTGIGGE